MSQLFEKNPMEGVKNIIVVASGKGGVRQINCSCKPGDRFCT